MEDSPGKNIWISASGMPEEAIIVDMTSFMGDGVDEGCSVLVGEGCEVDVGKVISVSIIAGVLVTFGFSVNLFESGIKLLNETVGELLIDRVLQLLSSINTRIKIIKRINFILSVFNADFHPHSFYAENTYKLYTSLNLF